MKMKTFATTALLVCVINFVAGIIFYNTHNSFDISVKTMEYSIEVTGNKKDNTFQVIKDNQDISAELKAEYPKLAPHMSSIVALILDVGLMAGMTLLFVGGMIIIGVTTRVLTKLVIWVKKLYTRKFAKH